MLRLIPGDPAHLLLGEFASPEEIVRIREKFGLDRSSLYQYLIYVKNLLNGDMGVSIRTNVPVFQEISVRFLATVELSFAAMIVSSLIGIVAGVISSVRKYSAFDYCSMVMALVGISMPIFWLGLMLIYLFSVKLGILPMMGRFTMGMEYEPLTGLVILDSLFRGDPGLLLNALAPHPSGLHACNHSHGHHRPDDKVEHARCDVQGLYTDGQGKGTGPFCGRLQARPEECFSSDHHGHRA
jgi:ABC-type dipeptide/oligopeptide/nickel transport system permease component